LDQRIADFESYAGGDYETVMVSGDAPVADSIVIIQKALQRSAN
jgi:hypothetical protein